MLIFDYDISSSSVSKEMTVLLFAYEVKCNTLQYLVFVTSDDFCMCFCNLDTSCVVLL